MLNTKVTKTLMIAGVLLCANVAHSGSYEQCDKVQEAVIEVMEARQRGIPYETVAAIAKRLAPAYMVVVNTAFAVPIEKNKNAGLALSSALGAHVWLECVMEWDSTEPLLYSVQ